ncbi:MAG TPA: hypothetical protein P5056_02100 [Candidatus Paceibacterota bacterium]|nr:hypothetical protein [Candidatus Paceibacterota bacterium]
MTKSDERMNYFDNVPFLNLDYFFHAVYRVIYFVPDLVFDTILFWTGITDSPFLKFIFGFLTVAALGVIFYSLYKIWNLHQAEKAAFEAIFIVEEPKKQEKKMINEEWADIMGHMQSPNSSSWVLAVIESDKIMDMLLRERGFAGKDLGEMLKSDKGKNLRTIQDAWEGHKIRNKIAHEAGHVLEKREAMTAIAHYESVFKELGFLD